MTVHINVYLPDGSYRGHRKAESYNEAIATIATYGKLTKVLTTSLCGDVVLDVTVEPAGKSLTDTAQPQLSI